MRKGFFMAPLLAAGLGIAQAGEVWRCGSSYGSAPCPGGTRLEVTAPPADAAQAAANVRRDQALADKMEKERLARETRAAKAVIPPEPRVSPPAPEKKPAKKGRKDAPFTAVSPR